MKISKQVSNHCLHERVFCVTHVSGFHLGSNCWVGTYTSAYVQVFLQDNDQEGAKQSDEMEGGTDMYIISEMIAVYTRRLGVCSSHRNV